MCFFVSHNTMRASGFDAFKEFRARLWVEEGVVHYSLEAPYFAHVYKKGTALDEEVQEVSLGINAEQELGELIDQHIHEGLHFKTQLAYTDLTAINISDIVRTLMEGRAYVFSTVLIIQVLGSTYVDFMEGEGVTDRFETYMEVVSPAIIQGCRKQQRILYFDKMLVEVQKGLNKKLREVEREK